MPTLAADPTDKRNLVTVEPAEALLAAPNVPGDEFVYCSN